MPKSLQDFDFPNGCDGKPILFLFRIDAFQGYNLVSFSVLTDKHTPWEPVPEQK